MRKCGICSECCNVLAVDELQKKTFSTCSHSCAFGCNIYSQRPGSCRDYRCLWLDGHLTDEDHPDKLGVIFTTTYHPEWGTVIMIVECKSRAISQPQVKKAIDQISDHMPLVLMRKDQTVLLLPPTHDDSSQILEPVDSPIMLTIGQSEQPAVAA